MSRIDYPKAIIPSIKYKLILNFELIENELLLVRRSNNSHADTFDENGFLRESAIFPIDVPNLSLNLLGGKFKLDNIDYIQKKQAAEAWQGEKINIIEFIGDIEKKANSVPILLWYKDINSKAFPYKRPKEQLKIAMLEALGYNPSQTPNTQLIPLEGVTQVIHSPTKSNYWHVELAIKQPDGSFIVRKNTGSNWGGKAVQTVLDIITNCAFSNISEASKDYRINKREYLN